MLFLTNTLTSSPRQHPDGGQPLNLRTPADIGATIRERRRSLGWDQATLAARVGVSRLWVNQVERGKPGAALGLVLRTLATLGIALDAMIPTADREPPSIITPDIDAIVAAARRREAP